MDPPLTIAVTDAPTNGAYPNPEVDPRDTIIPPLGRSFWFTSLFEMNRLPLLLLIPLNLILLIPVDSVIE